MNQILKLAKATKVAIEHVYYKLDYDLSTKSQYVFHRLRGGCVESRLQQYPSQNWTSVHQIEQKRSNRIALFVAYHPSKAAPLSNVNYVQSLTNCGFRVIYIHNGPLDKNQRAPIEPFCEKVICRENIGQDFGAWKDAFIHEYESKRLNEASWLLMCNDSNFFISSNSEHFESAFSSALAESGLELIALNMNQEITPHYQSYFICYHRNLFLSPGFVNFWNQYKPISNRDHAITNGEIKLSVDIARSAKAKVLYSTSNLYSVLRCNSLKELEFYRHLPKGCIYLSKASTNLISADGELNPLDLHRSFMILELHNPSHAFAILFVRYCKSPFLKKDIIKHDCFSLSQIIELLSDSKIAEDSQEWDEIISSYTLGGNNASYINNRKQAYRMGVPIVGKRFRGNKELMADLGLDANP